MGRTKARQPPNPVFPYETSRDPKHDEPELGATHTVRVYAIGGAEDGELLESFTTDDPYGAVEAAREVQAMPVIEERWAMYADRGW